MKTTTFLLGVLVFCALNIKAQKSDNRFVINEQGKYGYINKKGKIVIPLNYDHAGPFNQGLAPVRVGSQYFYINSKGQQAIDQQYDYAEPFLNNHARVYINQKPYLINIAGEILFEHELFELSQFYGNAAIAIVKDERGLRRGLVDATGAFVLAPEYENIIAISDNGIFKVFKKRQQWHQFFVVNNQGEIIIPQNKFFDIQPFKKGYAIFEGRKYPNNEKNRLSYGLVDEQGKVMFWLEDDGINLEGGVCDDIVMGEKSRQIYYYDLLGNNILLDTSYREGTLFADGGAFIHTGRKKSLLKPNGELKTTFRGKKLDDYCEVGFIDGIAIAILENDKYDKWVAINKKGRVKYKLSKSLDDNNSYVIGILKKKLLIIDSDHCKGPYTLGNKKGKPISEACFEFTEWLNDKKTILKVYNRFGDRKIVNTKGKVLWQEPQPIPRKPNVDYFHQEAYKLGRIIKADSSFTLSEITEKEVKIIFTDELDTIKVYYEMPLIGQRLNVVNHSPKKIGFDITGGYTDLHLQAKDENGEWKYILTRPHIECGFGAGYVWLEPGDELPVSLLLFDGDIKTKLRLRLDVIDKNKNSSYIYSEVFESYINYGQLWRRNHHDQSRFPKLRYY